MSSPFAPWMERYSIENPEHGIERDETDAMLGLLEEFRNQGKSIAIIEGESVDEKRANALAAMEDGVEIIFQACQQNIVV